MRALPKHRKELWQIVFLFVWFIGSGPVTAHDIAGIMAERDGLDGKTLEKFDQVERYRKLLAGRAATEKGLEGVVARGLLWSKEVILVCFLDGSSQAWDEISTTAETWTRGTRIRFDFGPKGSRRRCTVNAPSDVRVSFSSPGFWSYVGTLAKLIDSNKPTLNLSGMGTGKPLSSSDRGTVLHEFGHALGFEHEHQSPQGGCDAEFNWSYLYSYLHATQGWEKEDVDHNLRQLSNSSRRGGLVVTEFDRESIMLYSLNPQAFLNPASARCFVSRSSADLSPVDKATMRSVYPPRVGADPQVAEPRAAPLVLDADTQNAISNLVKILNSN